ncbi:hypothetical protein [Rhodovulum sp. ES.010]|uniref:hypothetical protein n=1 Tax=Rhodovulum sp. ES.010 TaxID=1882821 RepID=UPI0009415AC7|nr:hypothetical protein [Rhodovulum sp. ES.010]
MGFALANLIDIQRHLQRFRRPDAPAGGQGGEAAPDRDVVSADMLYRMAYFHDRYPDAEEQLAPSGEGVRTLRSAIKGFYHHGACLDWPDPSPRGEPARWQSTCFSADSPDRDRLFPSVEQAKKAREIVLGAYFRLASILNHFHAALNEAEAILVTANIHDGWLGATPATGGRIAWPPRLGKTGTHAFVLAGYDEHGFHVLNSWGPEWGGYQGRAGLALWSYDDWARNVIDGWVLRLGVRAPAAFGATIGEKGTKGLVGAIQTGSTPCLDLVGHYMHLDDGFHMATGSYPSFPESWDRTRGYLADKLDPKADPTEAEQNTYRGLLLWIPGSLEGIEPAFRAAVQRKAPIKALGLYPYSIFWCNNFVEKSLEVLEIIFESCKAQVGENAAHLDSLIEQRVQGVGRAFWRDIEMSARRAVRGTGELPYEPDETDAPRRLERGYLADLLADMMKLKAETGCELHLVAEGAGALVLHEMLSVIDEDAGLTPKSRRSFCGHDTRELFDSLHLVHPAIGMPRAQKLLVPLIADMNGKIAGKRRRASRARSPNVQPLLKTKMRPPARVYMPTPDLEEAVHFGIYGKSILHLVARSFEDRYPVPGAAENADPVHLRAPRPFLGMAEIAEDEEFQAPGAIYRLNRVVTQTHANDRVSQTELNRDATITNSIFESIKAMRRTD